MQDDGTFLSIPDLCVLCVCSWLALTDPGDVARIESKTVIITQEQRDTVPIPKTGLSQLGRWMSEEDFEKAFKARFPGCMKGERDVCLTGRDQPKQRRAYSYHVFLMVIATAVNTPVASDNFRSMYETCSVLKMSGSLLGFRIAWQNPVVRV